MKRFKYILIIVSGILLTTSCGKWLDVKPQDTTTQDKLFENFSGFRSALNGIYQELASSKLYGKEMTWGMVSALGQYYDNTNTDFELPYKYTALYEYKNKEMLDYGESIWTTGFNVIANCNNLIQHIQDFDRDRFPHSDRGEKELIQGEAYAIRGMMHFDLLRLFAPSYAASPKGRGIPYSTVYPDRVPSYKTVEEVIDLAIADLKLAYDLVKIYDQDRSPNKVEERFRSLSSDGAPDDFFKFRGTHLNMQAIEALLARAYLYKQDYTNAFTHANNLYTNEKANYAFTPTSLINASLATRERKLYHDLIMAFHNRLLIKDYAEFYIQKLGVNFIQVLITEARNVEYMYTSYRADGDDLRYTRLLAQESGRNTSLKYLESTNSEMNETQGMLLPVIRMSEVYYILAECCARQGDMDKAVSLLKEVRSARGAINRNSSITPSIPFSDFMDELEYETWKENLGEGQFFFFCKRLNKPTMRNGQQQIDMTGKWVMDIPQSETSLL